jgi:hypothetical protein
MNIFYLHHDTKICAQYHNDKHCIKMILESAQLLSTAHRVIDGTQTIELVNGRKRKRWSLDNPALDSVLYKATHVNHPSSVWVRQSSENYFYLATLLWDLSDEYTYRYGKIHKCMNTGLIQMLFENLPKNIPSKQFTEPTPAMPDECIIKGDVIASYRNYYKLKKQNIASWSGKVHGREVPDWY